MIRLRIDFNRYLLFVFAGFGFFVTHAHASLVDSNATRETEALATELSAPSLPGFRIGQQNATNTGVGWSSNTGTDFCGDLCKASGLHPAVYGWDYGEVSERTETDKELLRQKMIQAYEKGGINTLSWHMNNPVTHGPYNDLRGNACKRIQVGGDQNTFFLSEIDNLAEFLSKLKDANGTPIPVIFRPWHEANSAIFWWGMSGCGIESLRSLWAMSVKQLRDVDHVHQLLYAFAENGFPTDGNLYYPGNDLVDIVGLDYYFFPVISFLGGFGFEVELKATIKFAHDKGKIPALTEIGYENIPNQDWWTDVFLKNMKQNGIAGQMSYAMFWRNDSVQHHYVPYPGEASLPNFLKMAKDPSVLFLENIHQRP
jgi:mannan endo-1,4-beta-mannosidase